jgi:hypothetical protein
MKNATLLFKRDIDANTSVLVTFNYYSKDYQIRLNHAEGIRYQSARTKDDAKKVVLEYLALAEPLATPPNLKVM